MNKKKSILIVVPFILLMIGGCERNSNTDLIADADANRSLAVKQSTQIIAYYFHPKFRCPTCTMIEAMAKQTVEEKYAKEIASDRIVWIPINIDEPENRDFVKTFSLQTSTLVIAEMESDKIIRWKKLEDVWNLVNNRDKFTEYVTNEINRYSQD